MVNFRHTTMLIALMLVNFVAASAHAEEAAGFVGGGICAGCHATEAERWKGSHHARAMQQATPANVLGDFAGTHLEHAGVTTTFFRSGDTSMVRTDGPDGALRDFEIAYTFGVYPLQQYLIATQGGRYQALGIAWDSRPVDKAGQHWFHLYPGQTVPAGDRLHWTGRDQTWNYQCASCHSTDLRKNFDLTTNTYATTSSDVNVSCEACHGPGSRHVAWARSRAASDANPAAGAKDDHAQDERMGIVAWLKATDGGHWDMDPATGIAHRTQKLVSGELDVCAGCHARRKVIVDAPAAGGAFLDAYLPALLEPGLYHPDGQIDGEVFEYGSFLQSKMHHVGVACSNCHDPHSAKLRAEGNALCAQCHAPAKFDVTEHHHHQPDSAGARCANCHMPTKTYMVVDARRDHSLRVPRPDLSVSLGTPNACTACHAEKTADWAAQAVAGWFPNGQQTQPHYGTALKAGRTGAANAETLLDQLILDTSKPAIARASAVLLLPRNASAASDAAINAAIADPDPLVRAAVPRALSAVTAPATLRAGVALLQDPLRAVRVEAARALAGIDPATLTPQQQTALANATAELIAAEMIDAERPEAHLNLGLLDVRRRQPAEAAAEYGTALRLDPAFVPAMVNLADLDRMRGMDKQGVELLQHAIAIDPNNADVRHAMGLLLIRQKDYTEALKQLYRASELAPDNARYAYVYAIALNSTGAPRQAMDLLERVHGQHPTDRDVLIALVSMARDTGDFATALRHARELAVLYPADAQLHALVSDLERRVQ